MTPECEAKFSLGGRRCRDRREDAVTLPKAQDDLVNEVRHALTYYVALREANVPTGVHLYATGGHEFGARRTETPITE